MASVPLLNERAEESPSVLYFHSQNKKHHPIPGHIRADGSPQTAETLEQDSQFSSSRNKKSRSTSGYHIKEHVTSKTNPQQSLTNHHSAPRNCAEPPRGQFLAIFGIREAFLKIYAQKGYNEPIAGGLWHFKAPIVRGKNQQEQRTAPSSELCLFTSS